MEDASKLAQSRGSISFFRADSQDESMLIDPSQIPKRTADASAISTVSDSGIFESQQTQSFNYSDASSITRFPTFHFNLHALSSLGQVSKVPDARGRLMPATVKGRKVNLLLAILEVDGPETITIKNGKDAGKKIGLLKLILGDQEGSVCKLTAWREVADEWGGVGQGLGCKRGDVAHLESESPPINAHWPESDVRVLQRRCDFGLRSFNIAKPHCLSQSQVQNDDLL